jgi:hypothetical protein
MMFVSRLRNSLLVLVCLVLVVAIAAACGDDDDADQATTTVAPAEPSAAPTEVARDSDPATPTDAATVTATATTEQAPTESAVGGSPTVETSESTSTPGSPTAQALTEAEQALMAVLLSPADLPNEWNELRRTVPEDSDDPGFCDSGEFPRADEQLAQVEVELQSSDNAAFVLQNLTEFEEQVAVEAMQFARDSFSCSEFTDDEGTVFAIEPADDPGLGDESLAIKVGFQVADAGELQGNFVFMRVGGLVSILTVLELDNYDPERTEQFAGIAADKMVRAAGTTVGLDPADETLIEGLITQSDLPQGWNVLSTASPTDPEGWTGLCGATVNPGSAEATARVSVDFYEGLGNTDATVQQVITAYPADLSDAAMQWEIDSVNCTEWTAGSTTIALEPTEYSSDAGELFAVTFTYQDERAGDVTGNWIVIQVADFVSNLIYTDPEGIDAALAQELIDAAVRRMQQLPVSN